MWRKPERERDWPSLTHTPTHTCCRHLFQSHLISLSLAPPFSPKNNIFIGNCRGAEEAQRQKSSLISASLTRPPVFWPHVKIESKSDDDDDDDTMDCVCVPWRSHRIKGICRFFWRHTPVATWLSYDARGVCGFHDAALPAKMRAGDLWLAYVNASWQLVKGKMKERRLFLHA